MQNHVCMRVDPHSGVEAESTGALSAAIGTSGGVAFSDASDTGGSESAACHCDE